jgi:restriction system protein
VELRRPVKAPLRSASADLDWLDGRGGIVTTSTFVHVSDIVLPSYREMLHPTLVVLDQLGGSGHKDEVNERAIALLGVTDEQLSVEYPPTSRAHGSKVMHRLAFARSSLKLAGALENSKRGVWALNDRGRELLFLGEAAAKEADSVMRKQLRAKRLATATEPQPSMSPEDDELEATDEVVTSADWKTPLLEILFELTPAQFERLSARLLREVGFTRVQVLGGADDKGLDGVGLLEVQLLTFPVFFQCKRYRGQVGPSQVRDFRGAMAGRGDKGLFITTGIFTPAARDEATRAGVPPIDLIDGDRLCDLLQQHGLGISTRVVEEAIIEPGYFERI